MTKRALVLSGGGARGAFQVGMLKALIADDPESGLRHHPRRERRRHQRPAQFAQQVGALEKLWTETIVSG